jgi:signal recognition particle subunit SRP54
VGEKMFTLYETAINSMTPEERRKPEIINIKRRRRIALGAGLKDNQVGQMLNEFEQMRRMFQQFRTMMGAAKGSLPFGLGGKAVAPPPGPLKAPNPGFPLKGPGGGYYRKKGKR